MLFVCEVCICGGTSPEKRLAKITVRLAPKYGSLILPLAHLQPYEPPEVARAVRSWYHDIRSMVIGSYVYCNNR